MIIFRVTAALVSLYYLIFLFPYLSVVSTEAIVFVYFVVISTLAILIYKRCKGEFSTNKRPDNSLHNKYNNSINDCSYSSAIVVTVVAAVCIGGMVFFVVVVGPAITAFIAIPGVTGAILITAALLRRVSR